MIKSVRPMFVLLLLFMITVGLYCSSLIEITVKPAVIGIDDRGLMQYLLNHRLTFHDVFFVQSPGKYFRPLLGLSFLMDQRLWDETIFGYRLTNVILHACNTLLIYLIGRVLFNKSPYRDTISFAAALLFAVHPVCVESVAWISGRTDLLAGFWSLLAFYLYLSAIDKNQVFKLPLSLVCAMMAALSKETGIIIFILILGWEIYYHKNFRFQKMKLIRIFAFLLLSAGMLYFIMRFKALASQDMSTEMIFSRFLSGEVLSSLKLFLSSYGFYFKKFVFPFPLQFAIDAINVRAYALVGIVVILFFSAGTFIHPSKRYLFFYFWFLLGLFPAAIVSFSDIAWTPWAERYLYFSLAPLSLMSGLLFVQFTSLNGYSRNIASVCTAVVIISFTFFSVQRAHLWNDDLALAGDTFKKSPSFIPAIVQYASSLSQKGQRTQAEQELHKAELLQGPKHQVFYNLASLNMSKGNCERARQYFLYALADARNDQKLVLMGPYVRKNILVSLSNLEMTESNSCGRKKTEKHYRRAVEYLVEAYNEDPGDSFLLYDIAKIYTLTGNRTEAVKYFDEFLKKWDRNDIYRETAKKMLKKLLSPTFPGTKSAAESEGHYRNLL